MPARIIAHTLFLITAVVLTFFWTSEPMLNVYTLQLISLLTLFYFVNHLYLSKISNLGMSLDGLILSMVTLLLVFQTGGITSPIFFFIYILLFGLALLFDPLITLSLSIALGLLFFNQVQNLNNFLQITGLLLITPIAIFFGKQYLKVLADEEKIKIIIRKKVAVEKEKTEEEKDTELWLALDFKEHVNQIIDVSSNLLADVGRLSVFQKEELHKIHESAKRLMKMGERLKDKLDNE